MSLRLPALLAVGFLTVLSFPRCDAIAQHAHATPRKKPDHLTPGESIAVSLYERVIPTVVTIRTRGGTAAGRVAAALGTGVVISSDGLVLTAAHVVEGAREIVVSTHDGVGHAASVRFSESDADLALLQLEGATSLPHAELGDSDALAVGQTLYVVGSPLGLEGSLTVGSISGFRDFQELYDGTIRAEFIQTDASINSGNSGGPAFDSRGDVVGIASRILSRSGGFEGIGFLVTINTARELMALEGRAWTGLRGAFLSHDELEILFHIDLPGALLVQSVAPGSPAARAGLRPGTIPARIGTRDLLLGGDLILEIGGQETCHGGCLASARERIAASEKIGVRFLRGADERKAVLDVSATRWDVRRRE